VFRVTSDLVQFDALFLDAHGRPLADVRMDEVTVSQDGRTVGLADLRFVPRGSHMAEAPFGAASSDPRVTDDIESWIFVIDDLAMSPDAFTRVKNGLRAQLREASVANIQIGILRTGELGHRTTQLSNSRDALLRTIDAMRYRPNRWRGGVMSRSGATGAGHGSGDRVFLEGTLGSLNSLLISLRQLTGRKVVVVVSQLLALTASDADDGAHGQRCRCDPHVVEAARAGG